MPRGRKAEYETTCPSCQAVFDVDAVAPFTTCSACGTRIRLEDDGIPQHARPARPARPAVPTWALLLLGLAAPLLLTPFVLRGDEMSEDAIQTTALVVAAVATAVAVAVLLRAPPWKDGQGPWLFLAAVPWTVATLASGDAISQAVIALPIAGIHLLFVLAGFALLAARRPAAARTCGHVGALGALVGIGLGCLVLLAVGFA